MTMKVSDRDRRALLLCGAVVLLSLPYFYLVDPLITRYQSAAEALEKVTAKTAKLERPLRLLRPRQAKLLNLRTNFDTLLMGTGWDVAPEQRLTRSMQDFKRVSEFSGVEMVSIRPLAREDARDPYFEDLTFEVDFQGGYSPVLDMLFTLESGTHPNLVKHLELREDAGQIRGRLTVDHPYLRGDSKSQVISPVRAGQQMLRLGIQGWAGYGPLFIADKLGYLSTDSESVSLIQIDSDSSLRTDFMVGNIDAAVGVLSDCYAYSGKSFQPVVALCFDVSLAGEAIVVPVGSSIRGVKDLAGKTLGVVEGSLSHYVLYRALALEKMRLGDVRVRSTQAQDVVSAIVASLIDAGVTWDPFLSAGVQSGRVRTIFDSAALPGEIMDILLVSSEAISQKAAAMRLLVTGFARAVEWWRLHPDEGNEIIARRMGTNKTALLETLREVTLLGVKDNQSLLCKAGVTAPEILGRLERVRDFFETVHGFQIGKERTAQFVHPALEQFWHDASSGTR